MALIRTRAIRANSRGGFTLLEVMISLAVLAFGLLALAAMQLHALKGGRAGRHTTQAMAIAQDQMERFQRLGFTGMADSGGAWTGTTTVINAVVGSSTQTEQSYTVDWRITDDVAGWTKIVDVRVTWNEPDRPNRQFVLTSRRFNW